MTDAINKACAALRRSANVFRAAERNDPDWSLSPDQVRNLAEECEAALRDLRTQASGEERSGQ